MPKTSQVTTQVKLAQGADRLHEWPHSAGECTERTHDIFVKNQSYRAYDDWSEPDLFELARMSKLQEAAVDLQEVLDDEGYVILGGKSGNTPVENPAGRALATLNSSINSISRRLATNFVPPSEKKARGNRSVKARDMASDNDGDDALLN